MNLARRDRRSLALLGTWVLTCAALFWLIYYLTVRTEGGRVVADASLRGAILSEARAGGLVDNVLGFITVASLAAAVAVVATIALVRLRRDLGLAAIGVLVLANLSAQVLKGWLIPRPDLGLSEYAPVTLNSLPGGHSTAAFSVVVALLIVVPVRLRGAVALTGGAYACVVALASMAAGWHRAGDSEAAFLLVGLWAGVALGALVIWDRAEIDADTPSESTRRRRRSLLAAAVLTTMAGLVSAVGLASSTRIRESRWGEAAAYATTGLFVVVTAVVVLLGLLAILERLGGRPTSPADGVHPDLRPPA